MSPKIIHSVLHEKTVNLCLFYYNIIKPLDKRDSMKKKVLTLWGERWQWYRQLRVAISPWLWISFRPGAKTKNWKRARMELEALNSNSYKVEIHIIHSISTHIHTHFLRSSIVYNPLTNPGRNFSLSQHWPCLIRRRAFERLLCAPVYINWREIRTLLLKIPNFLISFGRVSHFHF